MSKDTNQPNPERKVLILIGNEMQSQAKEVADELPHLDAYEVRGNGKRLIHGRELVRKDKNIKLAVLCGHGLVADKDNEDIPKNQKSHLMEDLIKGNKYTDESMLQVQRETGAKNFFVSSCYGAKVLADFLRYKDEFEDGTELLVFASSKYSTISATDTKNIIEVARAYNAGEDLKQIAERNIPLQAQSILYAHKKNDKEIYVSKSVSPKSEKQIEKLDTKNPASFKEYWQKHSTKVLEKEDDGNGKFVWKRRNIESSSFDVSEDEAQNYLDKCLWEAAFRDKEERVQDYINVGADFNNPVFDNVVRPLWVACQEGHYDVVEVFLKQEGIEVNRAENLGFTPLHKACEKGYADVVELLLKHENIDVNRANNLGSTPLHIACEKGYADVVELLLKHKNIDVNRANSLGYTPLQTAGMRSKSEIVKKIQAKIDELEQQKAPEKQGPEKYKKEKPQSSSHINKAGKGDSGKQI